MDSLIIALGVFLLVGMYVLLKRAETDLKHEQWKTALLEAVYKYCQIQIMKAKGVDVPAELIHFENDLEKLIAEDSPEFLSQIKEL